MSDQNNWNPWFAPLALVSALVLEVVVGFVVLLIGLGVHPTQAQLNNPPPAVTDVSTGLGEACFVAVAIWLASLRGRPWPAQFGMRRPAVGVLKVFLFVAGGYSGTGTFTLSPDPHRMDGTYTSNSDGSRGTWVGTFGVGGVVSAPNKPAPLPPPTDFGACPGCGRGGGDIIVK